jgi:hypothetical protein
MFYLQSAKNLFAVTPQAMDTNFVHITRSNPRANPIATIELPGYYLFIKGIE